VAGSRTSSGLASSAKKCRLILPVVALFAAGCGGHAHVRASRLGIVSARTPRFPVAGFHTYGTFPQLRGRISLARVNAAVRNTISDDQDALVPRARSYVAHAPAKVVAAGYAGFYETELDRTLVSASNDFVSMLLPRTRQLLPARGLNDGWLAITVRVPSGKPVAAADLFDHPAAAVRFLRARTRDKRSGCAFGARPELALLPSGLAVGVPSRGSCYRFDVVVPYREVRRYLSPLGTELAANARWPSYRLDSRNLTYCRRPDLSGAELSASGGVPCTTVRKAESAVFSQRCGERTRCVVAGFTCRGVWSGRPGSFVTTHHAECRRGRQRIRMDEG
jgi:hypothetical protein